MTTQHKACPAYFKAVTDGSAPEGTFDAVVAVFSNIDLGGDRIIPGAFEKSIAKWKASGDPVPVIFSHQWDDLNAHVGSVDPNNLKELLPGDPELPPELKSLGGLLAKGAQMDLEAPGEAGAFATNLWQKMKARAIKEFSFAYDIGQARPTKDAMDLIELDLIEIGPTLKGMNPATALLGAKSARKAIEGMTPSEALDMLDGMITPPPPRKAAPSLAPAALANGTKRLPMGSRPDGAIENTLDAIGASARVWAGLKYGNELYACHIEATLLDEKKAVVTTERWSDPYGEGPLWELAYTLDEKGATITDANPVEVTVSLNTADPNAAKRRLKQYLGQGADRKTAIWLCLLDDQAVEAMYVEGGPEPVVEGGGSTGFAARGSYPDAQQGHRLPSEGKAQEPSAADSPIGVLLEFDGVELTNP